MNLSKRPWRRGRVWLRLAVACCSSLLLFVLATPLIAQTSLPDLGDSSTTALSPAEEARLGRRFMRQVRQHLALVEDVQLVEYLDNLGAKLASAAGIDPDDLHFFLINDPTLNAFAAPGGFIGVHTGLFIAAEDESELAAVIAHELAHTSQRHLARLIARSKEVSLPAMAAILAGVLIGGQAGVAALTTTNAAVSSDSLSYSRNFEREADAIGIRTLANAGFDPSGMTRFFAHMQRWARVQEIDVPEFLRTHPLTLNRIAEAEARVAGLVPGPTSEQSEFPFIRAAIRANYSKRVEQTTREFRAELDEQQGIAREATQYGLALAYIRSSQFNAAREIVSELLADDGSKGQKSTLRYQLAHAEIDLKSGRVADATKTLADLHESRPNDAVVTEHYANALVQAGDPAAATTVLKSAVRKIQSESLYKLLARAASESDQPLIAHTALAEYHYYRDELAKSLDQFRTAREFANQDNYRAARIEARIDAIEVERRENGG